MENDKEDFSLIRYNLTLRMNDSMMILIWHIRYPPPTKKRRKKIRADDDGSVEI